MEKRRKAGRPKEKGSLRDEGFATIGVTRQTRDRLKELAGDVPLSKYLKKLTERATAGHPLEPVHMSMAWLAFYEFFNEFWATLGIHPNKKLYKEMQTEFEKRSRVVMVQLEEKMREEARKAENAIRPGTGITSREIIK